MDPECIRICNLINRIDGLETILSCCGHGKSDFNIWLIADMYSGNLEDTPGWRGLQVLARALYCNPYGWNLVIDCSYHNTPRLVVRGPVGFAGLDKVCDDIEESIGHWYDTTP